MSFIDSMQTAAIVVLAVALGFFASDR